MTQVTRVDTLREALADLPGDMLIYSQVVATNGDAWTMYCTLNDVCGANPPAKVLTMTHPTLTHLPTAFKSTEVVK